MVIGILTSSNSKNVIKAIQKADSLGCFTVGLTGRSGGKLKDTVKMVIRVDSDFTPIIQEMHIAIGHIVSNIVEDLVSNEQAV